MRTFFMLPIIVFLFVARLYGFSGDGWPLAFYLGGAIALAQSVFIVQRGMLYDRLIMGLNLFLCVGAVGFLFTIKPLLAFYEQYQFMVPFFFIVPIGVVTTFFTEAGFVGCVNAPPKVIQELSL